MLPVVSLSGCTGYKQTVGCRLLCLMGRESSHQEWGIFKTVWMSKEVLIPCEHCSELNVLQASSPWAPWQLRRGPEVTTGNGSGGLKLDFSQTSTARRQWRSFFPSSNTVFGPDHSTGLKFLWDFLENFSLPTSFAVMHKTKNIFICGTYQLA